jgi:hypothetical protein
MSSLPAVIGVLGSPLGPHPETDLATNLYSGSTPIARYDETDRQVSIKFHQKNLRPRSQRRSGH